MPRTTRFRPRLPARPTRRQVGAGLGLLLLFVLVAASVGLSTFRGESRQVVVGAHSTTVRPTFDGYATFDLGPLVPRLRVPIDQPLGLGLSVDVGETVLETSSLEELIQRDALIASQPAGELRAVRLAVVDMARDAALRGVGAGFLVCLGLGGGWRLLGAQRRGLLIGRVRRALHERPWRTAATAAGLAVCVVAATTLVLLPTGRGAQAIGTVWVPLGDLAPDEVPVTGELGRIQVAQGAAAAGGVALVESALKTYNDSVEFYGELADSVPDVGEDFRQPAEEETVAILVSDRHDNIGMDPVARALADAAGATLAINAGDDTSTGAAWEEFSVNSFAEAFADLPVVAVAGNHDGGDTVVEGYREAGFTVLESEPVEVEGIRFLGDHDPRSSALTANISQGSESVAEQGERLAEVACDDGDVDVLVVHAPSSGYATAESGCVPLVVTGHLHRQVGPETYQGEAGESTLYTNGTTGGAAFALALGSKLRRTAQVTMLTFDTDGVPVGLQPVEIPPGGQIAVGDYVEIPVPPEDAADQPDDSDASGGDQQDPSAGELDDPAPTEAPRPGAAG